MASSRGFLPGSSDQEWADAAAACQLMPWRCDQWGECLLDNDCFRKRKADRISTLERKVKQLEAQVKVLMADPAPAGHNC